MISVKVIADSVAPHGKRITTFVLEYPRFVHAEFMTHRLFSRNAASSRAIPVQKMLDRVKKDPALPIHWGRNQPGMQAREEVGQTTKDLALANWLYARNRVMECVELLHDLGIHKQVANRLLEPWMHIAVVCTATEWGNFFNLRYHPDAQPEMQELARVMWVAMSESNPQVLGFNEWHLPFITLDDYELIPDLENLKKSSAARCARVSYLNHEGKQPTLEEDLTLFGRLMGGFPKHASPTEHQAKPSGFGAQCRSGNLIGWEQFRKTIPGEHLPDFNGQPES